jgi:hypothetical protein
MPRSLRTLLLAGLVAAEAAAQAQNAASLDQTLEAWHVAARGRKSLAATLFVRELDANGRWLSTEPWTARLCFAASPNRARLDLDSDPPRSWTTTSDRRLLLAGRPPRVLDEADVNRANVWIGDFPLFLLLGPEPELLEHRYQVRLFPSAPGERSVYLYPQRIQERKEVARLEVRLDARTCEPFHIHVVYVDGRHLFFIVDSIDETAAIDPDRFERL